MQAFLLYATTTKRLGPLRGRSYCDKNGVLSSFIHQQYTLWISLVPGVSVNVFFSLWCILLIQLCNSIMLAIYYVCISSSSS